jgi:DNA-binding IclR family transcriptional regulator
MKRRAPGSTDNGATQRAGDPVIQAVSRAAQILTFFTEDRPELPFAEIVERSGLGKATAHRYAMSLRQEGLLQFNARTGRYSLGIKLMRLGRIAQSSLQVLEVARPHLDDLARDLEETVILAMKNEGQPVVAGIAYPPGQRLFVGARVGDRLAPEAAQSVVMRAYGDDAGSPDLAEVRERGYAVTEYRGGLTAIACPLFAGEEVVATVAVLGPTATVGPALTRATAGLRRAAEEIARNLEAEPEGRA